MVTNYLNKHLNFVRIFWSIPMQFQREDVSEFILSFISTILNTEDYPDNCHKDMVTNIKFGKELLSWAVQYLLR